MAIGKLLVSTVPLDRTQLILQIGLFLGGRRPRIELVPR